MTAQVSNNRSTVVSKWRSVFHRTLSNSHNDDTLPHIRSDYGEQRNIFPPILGTHRRVDQYNYDAGNAWELDLEFSLRDPLPLPSVAHGDGMPLKN